MFAVLCSCGSTRRNARHRAMLTFKKNANALVLKINRILVMTGLTSLLSLKLLRLEPEVIQLIANSLEVSGDENISPSQSVTPP